MKTRQACIETEAEEATGLMPRPALSSSTRQLQCNWSGFYDSHLSLIDICGSILTQPRKMARDDVGKSDTTFLSKEARIMPVTQKVQNIMKPRSPILIPRGTSEV